jgi:hypothetical protein
MGSKLVQILIAVAYVMHDNQRCKVGDVIEVSPEAAKDMVARGEAEYYAEEQDFAVLGQQPLIADDDDDDDADGESELTPAQKAAKTRARNAAKKAAEEAES